MSPQSSSVQEALAPLRAPRSATWSHGQLLLDDGPLVNYVFVLVRRLTLRLARGPQLTLATHSPACFPPVVLRPGPQGCRQVRQPRRALRRGLAQATFTASAEDYGGQDGSRLWGGRVSDQGPVVDSHRVWPGPSVMRPITPPRDPSCTFIGLVSPRRVLVMRRTLRSSSQREGCSTMACANVEASGRGGWAVTASARGCNKRGGLSTIAGVSLRGRRRVLGSWGVPRPRPRVPFLYCSRSTCCW